MQPMVLCFLVFLCITLAYANTYNIDKKFGRKGLRPLHWKSRLGSPNDLRISTANVAYN